LGNHFLLAYFGVPAIRTKSVFINLNNEKMNLTFLTIILARVLTGNFCLAQTIIMSLKEDFPPSILNHPGNVADKVIANWLTVAIIYNIKVTDGCPLTTLGG